MKSIFGKKAPTVAYNSPRAQYFIAVLYFYNIYNGGGLIIKCDKLFNFALNILLLSNARDTNPLA